MENQSFICVGVEEGKQLLPALHRRVVDARERVEFVGDSPDASVLISKAELESLEHALSILAGLPGASRMRRQLRRIGRAEMARMVRGVP